MNKIQQGFSESAGRYDRFSGLHREIADKLLLQIVNGSVPSTILDVGCGTGYLTRRAKEQFPSCKIIGLDFAPGMLEVARGMDAGIEWVLGNSDHLPFADGSFDRVISNLAYQWAGDLAQAFGEARRVLSSDGILACTLFGYNTCQELFQSLDKASKTPLQFSRLPQEGQIRRALIDSGFVNPKVRCEQVKIDFKDMSDLVIWLKSIGANHLSREGYVGKDIMIRAAAIYREEFSSDNGVQASFEVIRIYGKK